MNVHKADRSDYFGVQVEIPTYLRPYEPAVDTVLLDALTKAPLHCTGAAAGSNRDDPDVQSLDRNAPVENKSTLRDKVANDADVGC
jgi:hypothetical protein